MVHMTTELAYLILNREDGFVYSFFGGINGKHQR